jgi:DNA-binding transcriptional regulator YhcF (GntR family)
VYVTKQMLATKYGCSVRTISRVITEMEQTGLYPMAIRRICGVQVNDDDFERYLCRRKRNGKKSQVVCAE